jgi:hypothetical protein
MWEAWLYAVFKPPYNKRRPSARPRKPPLFPRARRRDKPVEEPMAMAKYVKLIGASLTGASVCVATTSFSSDSNTALNTHMDKPPPEV